MSDLEGVASRITDETPMISLEHTGEILAYVDGAYVPGGEIIVEQSCEELIPDCTTEARESVLEIVRRATVTPRMCCDPPGLLVCSNGLLDLHTMSIESHSPLVRCRTKLDVEYDPCARAPQYTDMIYRILPDGPSREALHRAFGSALLRASCPPPAPALLLGGAAGVEGHDLVLGIMERVLGPRNVAHLRPSDVMHHPYMRSQLDGRIASISRYNTVSELLHVAHGRGILASPALAVQQKGAGQYLIPNHARLFLSCNDPRPPARILSHFGCVIRFSDCGDCGADSDLDSLLAGPERSGILNLLIEAAGGGAIQ